jgi:hypothetical protein
MSPRPLEHGLGGAAADRFLSGKTADFMQRKQYSDRLGCDLVRSFFKCRL